MKKLFLVNLDVGSGIEYAGNMFLKILQKKYEVFNYKHQNPYFIVLKDIMSKNNIEEYKSKLIKEINNFTLGEYSNKHLKEVIKNL